MSDYLQNFEIVGHDLEGLSHLEERFGMLQEALNEKHPGNIIDQAKCFIEAIFRTIDVNYYGVEQKDRIDRLRMPQLFEEVEQIVKLSPDERLHTELMTRCREAFESIARVRNAHGASAHGYDGEHESVVEFPEAVYVAQMAVAVGMLFYGQHRNKADWRTNTRQKYEDNLDFNEWFDEQNEVVELAGSVLQPSEVLFSTDLKAYRNALVEFMGNKEQDTQD
ncbi:MAG: hypothetical protein RL538_287 [Candidatus Parcubacteria bacterium]|jgi:hypothetical protein